jgi:AmpE protein
MNFLALFLGLGIERLVTHLFHLREFHWLDPLFDWVLRKQRVSQPNLAIIVAALLAAAVVLPVGLIELGLNEKLAQIPQFVFAVIVLLFCLGPRDLGEEVNDYCKAVEAGDSDEVRSISEELLECVPGPGQPAQDVECAIYAQANNRIFGVVFWFVMLGPTGAWLFRVLDLMQRRAVHYVCEDMDNGDSDEWPAVVQAMLILHRLFAWVPARLLAVGYMLAGSFEGALEAWKTFRAEPSRLFPGPNDQLLGTVGRGAAPDVSFVDSESDVTSRALLARDLVGRTLWMIWCPILALLTLYDLML